MSNAMTAKFAIHGIALTVCIVFNYGSDFIKTAAGSAYLDGFVHGLARYAAQFDNIWMDISKEHHTRVVTVVPILVTYYINI